MMQFDIRKQHAGRSVERGNVGEQKGGVNASSLEEYGQTWAV